MTEQAEALLRRWYGSPIPEAHLQIITYLQQHGPTHPWRLEGLDNRPADCRAIRDAISEMREKGVVYINYNADLALSPDKADKEVLLEIFERLYLRQGNDGCELFWHDPDCVPRPSEDYKDKNVFRVRVSDNGYAHDCEDDDGGKRTMVLIFGDDDRLERIEMRNEDNLHGD